MAHILLVEDDILLAEGVRDALQLDGHTVAIAHTAAGARESAQIFDLYLLDIRLPDGNGLPLCTALRRQQNAPVIFLTANDTEADVVRGFEAGCDDYITKPFSPAVLWRRVLAVLRRTGRDVQRLGELEIDLERATVQRNGSAILLTATEWKLLALLVKHRGRVLPRDTLLHEIWDLDGNFIDENTLRVHVRRLRQKLEPDPQHPRYIITVFGVGYTLGDLP